VTKRTEPKKVEKQNRRGRGVPCVVYLHEALDRRPQLNVEPQVYLLLHNEAESRCSTTDQISRPWSKSKRPIASSLLAGIASYLPAIPRNSRRSWTGLRSDSKG